MASNLQQNWDSGICRRFEIPSANHIDEAHEDVVYSIHLRAPYLVSGSKDTTVRIWNVETLRLIRPPLRSHEASVLCVQFDDRADQDVIISGGADSSFIVWRFSTGEVLKKIEEAHEESVLSLCFDDEHLVTGSKDKTIKIWNRREVERDGQTIPAYSELRTLTGHIAAVNVVNIRNNTLVSGGGDRNIHIWNAQTGKMLRTLTGHATGIACLQYTGNLIISGSSDTTVRVFDLEQPEDQADSACLTGHTGVVRTVQAQTSTTGTELKRIISGSYDETVKIWVRDATSDNWTSNITLCPPRLGADNVNRVFKVQSDEQRLICCTQSNVITGWDFSSGEEVTDPHEVDATQLGETT